jgi:hypothetical protein
MNTHKNARLTFARRLELVRDMTSGGLSPGMAGSLHGVSALAGIFGPWAGWLGRPILEACLQPEGYRAWEGAGDR